MEIILVVPLILLLIVHLEDISHMSGHRLPKPNANKCQDIGYPTH
jgi:hypothetical protein